jgi:2-C-methyl-D-erythritol 4-phosphate cytidylyltransferase
VVAGPEGGEHPTREPTRATVDPLGEDDDGNTRRFPLQAVADPGQVAADGRGVRAGDQDSPAKRREPADKEARTDERRPEDVDRAHDCCIFGQEWYRLRTVTPAILARMRIHALVLAGGTGDRFGAEMPKQFIRLAGEPILSRSLRAIAGAGVDQVVVVVHPSWLKEARSLVDAAGIAQPCEIVTGGATRNESTRNGLAALHADPDDIVVVHDAVRPLVPAAVIQRSIEPILAGRAEATDTVIASADTLVIVDGDIVTEIPRRSRYRRGQTPQTFRFSVLQEAYERAARANELSATDDCSLVLRHVPSARVVAVDGDEANVKITTRTDMILADRMIQLRTFSEIEEARPAQPLDGSRLYVIGGTNGIGEAIVAAAREAGATVAVDGRRLGLDVRDAASVQAHVQAAAAALGGLDHVVCTAGVLRLGRAVDLAPAELAEVIEVNVIGSLLVARAAHPYLATSKGSLTLFASSSFTLGRPNYVAYSASKAAVVNLAQGLAEEWAEDGIRVNAVSPERTDTPMRRQAFPTESRSDLLSAEEVAQATLRLVRSNLSGQVLDVRRHDAAGRPGESTASSMPPAPEAPDAPAAPSASTASTRRVG